MRHIPEWLPWFSYKPLARIGRDIGREVVHEPIRFVKESIVSHYTINTPTCDRDSARPHKLNGTAQPSLALKNLQKAERLEGSEKVKAEKTIRETLGSLYAGQ